MPEVQLPDGRRLAYTVRISSRGKNFRLRLNAYGALIVTAPRGVSIGDVATLVARNRDWILDHLQKFERIGPLPARGDMLRPQTFDLPAIDEHWEVEYVERRGKAVSARSDGAGRVIVMSGAIIDPERCHAALRCWLARRAEDVLGPWLEALSAETGLRFKRVTIRNQRTRWGSCSVSGNISLNCKLLFLPGDLVRHVLIHELCHTVEHNHSQRFKALVSRYEPGSDVLRNRLRDAWRLIPAWAHA